MGKRFIIFLSLFFVHAQCFGAVFSGGYSTKTTPVIADKALISDSQANNASKSATLGSLPISTATQTALDLKLNTADVTEVTVNSPLSYDTGTDTLSIDLSAYLLKTAIDTQTEFENLLFTLPAGGSSYVATPWTYSDETCTSGQYAFDTSYAYVCVSSGDINRISLTDWNNPTPAGSSYDYDFEEAGTPTDWSIKAGTPDFDYTTAAIEGSESLFLAGCADAADTRAQVNFSETGSASFDFLFKINAAGGGASGSDYIVQIEDGTVGYAYAFLSYDSATTYHLRVQSFGGTAQETTGTMTVGTTYKVCVTTTVGSGSDAVTTGSFVAWTGSESCPGSGDDYVASTDGTQTASTIDNAWFGGEYTSGTDCFDTIFDGVNVQ